MTELRAATAAARRGEGGVILFEAPAGLGKTRLLERARRGGVSAGMTTLAARATELEQEFPFGIVRQLFEPLLAGLDHAGRAEVMDGSAATSAPALGNASRSGTTDSTLATLYGLYSLAVNVSRRRPLLIALDDAHWADLASLQFLAFLAPRLEHLPILLAVASRPVSDISKPLMHLTSDPRTRHVHPSPLGPTSTAGLIGSALGEPSDAAFTAACHELTAGNPFLLTELIRALAMEGIRPRSTQISAIHDLVPDTIARSVLVRLASLSDDAQRLARAVAILGDACEHYLVVELTGLSDDSVTAAADDLRYRAILDPDSPLRFLHPLVRKAVYLDIPAGARSREHHRAATLLDKLDCGVARVAIHLLATDPTGSPEVVEALCDAARESLRCGAPEPAVAYLRRALAEPLTGSVRLDTIELLVTAAVRAADLAAIEPFEEELLAALAAEPERLRRAALDVATTLIGSGRRTEGLALLERAVEAADSAHDLRLAVMLDAHLLSYGQALPEQARAHFARYDGRLADDTAEQRLTLALRSAWISQLGGRATEAAALATRALAGGHIFDESPDLPPLTQAILVLTRADELDAAHKAAEQMIASATHRGSMVGLVSGWFARAGAARRGGELGLAEEDIRRVAEAGRISGFMEALPPATALLIEILLDRDRVDEADSALAEFHLDGDLPDGFWYGTVLFSRGRLRLAQGRAREAADDLLALRDRMADEGARDIAGQPAGSYAGVALAQLAQRERAQALVEEDLAALRRWGAPSAVAEGMTALGTVTGGSSGIDMLEQAVGLAAKSPARLVHAIALVELGTLQRVERRPEARDSLRAGLELARRSGATSLARRAASELYAAGETVARHTPIGADALTSAERHVAELAGGGMTNREIAAARFVTVKTVESQLRAVYDKLGIKSRRGLVDALSR